MLNREEIYNQLKVYLIDLFEVPADSISNDAKLFEDLDLDSIDAIDLIIKLQEVTEKKISPEEFKTVSTVGDIVEHVYKLVNS